MKYNLLLSCVVAAFLFCSCQHELGQVIVKNPTSGARSDETVVLKRSQLVEQGTEDVLPVLVHGKDTLASQVDDMDRDGKWDELAFIVNLAGNEEQTLKVAFVAPDKYPTFEKRTNLRLGIRQSDNTFKEVDRYSAPPANEPFKIIAQGESVAWENDKMGFRVYFDCRNVKDLYGKLKPGMVLDKIHTPALGDYHKLADWGMDVLHCGSSLGSGGLAMLEQDSLYRLGSTPVYDYQKITEGPVRSVFDLIYDGWTVGDEKLSAVERISIYPGKYWFQSDVTVSGFSGQKQLVTGIVTSKLTNTPHEFKVNADYQAIATLDKQSLNGAGDELGMAVMLKAKEVTKIARSSDINFFKEGIRTVPEKGFSQAVSETYYIAQKIDNKVPARHYFMSVWGLENPKWKQIDSFRVYMSEEADKLSLPIAVSVKK
ncbi:MAG: DUF4861 domain-containing protein [Bacteroidales bacterium]